ncbi:unnamed protein product [Adineta steineri]|uniref:EGF-like domain-containing protein n=1 Tax=Adineta steineri TaxID=433720 RepID=A0A813YAG1_9BILA|nr:unnamed protein product [Adineta steineri]
MSIYAGGCQNGGTCNDSDGTCTCRGQYTGKTCSECLCQNGGTCDGYQGSCQCKGKWTGVTCTNPTIPPCSAASCCDTDSCISCDDSYTYCRGINDKDIGNDPITRSRFGLAGVGAHDRYFGVFSCPYACSSGGDGLRGGLSLNASAC